MATSLISLEGTDSNHYWMDSGSTAHISNNRSHFRDLASSSGVVGGVGSEVLQIEGTGTIVFALNGYTYTMNDVLYVPAARKNLISIRTCDSRGALFSVGNNQIFDVSFNQVIGSSNSSDLYLFLPVVQPPLVSVSLAAITPDYHARLGHPHPDVLRSLGLPSSSSKNLCPACIHGKTTKVYPKVSATQTTAPLELLHADVAGPFPFPGMNTERYFLTIVDDFTRWTYAVPIHNKSDVAQILQDFITASETHFSSRGYKVVAIRTDNGGEFCSDAVDSFLLSKGIAHQHTVPYNSHQNGVVERKHRTLEEKVLYHQSPSLTRIQSISV
ncbi:unnamed protein product [[Candida] boidinii]|nr:unnamed protein product [[Candida] boidinii]